MYLCDSVKWENYLHCIKREEDENAEGRKMRKKERGKEDGREEGREWASCGIY